MSSIRYVSSKHDLVGDSLDNSNLQALANGELAAIHVRGFLPSGPLKDIANRLDGVITYGVNPYSQQVGCLGISFHYSAGKPELREIYHRDARVWEQTLRDLSSPHQSPADSLEEAIRAVWPAGLTREDAVGRPMFAGITRLFHDGAGALPHRDSLARDAGADHPKARNIRSQLAAYLYLSTSEEGGEVEVWTRRLSDDEFESVRIPGTDDADRDKLGLPDLIIRPASGDLLIYDAGLLHGAAPTRGGLRANVSMFLAYRGEDIPMTCWS
jgi:hypothetical protein